MKDYGNLLIMTDLDGTFFGKDASIVERNMKALEEFEAHGGLFSFATGRVHTVVEKELIPGFCDLLTAPAVMCNGVNLYDPKAKKVLVDFSYPGELVRPITAEIVDKYRPPIWFIYTGEDYYRHTSVDPRKVADEVWHKVVFHSDPETILKIRDELRAKYGDILQISRSGWNLCEILPKESGKGGMLRKLKEDFAAQGRDVMTFGIGDFENDLGLLEEADFAAAPANALPEIRAAADRVFCDHTKGAVAELIEYACKYYAKAND